MKEQYLVRFVQMNETFRCPELEALASLEDVKLSILDYRDDSPFCVVQLDQNSQFTPTSSAVSNPTIDPASDVDSPHLHGRAASFISRSILSKAIFHIWGQGTDYDSLHADVKSRTSHLWPLYLHKSFKFSVDTYYAKRSMSEQRQIINSFSYLGFQGATAMKNPEVEFVVMEEWEYSDGPGHGSGSGSGPNREQHMVLNGQLSSSTTTATPLPPRAPKRLFFGRLIGRATRRGLIEKHDLKKRPYISTTSMDAELALVTATLALAQPGKLFLDPFVGTGGFMVAASELGAMSLGSDIDGRSFRGKGAGMEKGVASNFAKYGLQSLFGDCIVSDLTNSPLRVHSTRRIDGPNGGTRGLHGGRWLDGIISDPPYGVREGLRVLGLRKNKTRGANMSLKDSPAVDPTLVTNAGEIVSPLSNGTNSSSVTHQLESLTFAQSTYHQEPTEDDHQTHSTANHMRNQTKDRLGASSTAGQNQNQTEPTIQKHPPSTDQNQTQTQTQNQSIDKTKRNPTPEQILTPTHKRPGYIHPKKPYSLDLLLNDILEFASATLVTGGRLAFWMPSANQVEVCTTEKGEADEEEAGKKREKGQKEEIETKIPEHPNMRLRHVCTQSFNKWSRKLLVYERVDVPPSSSSILTETTPSSLTISMKDERQSQSQDRNQGLKANDLNPFRRMYFRSFQ